MRLVIQRTKFRKDYKRQKRRGKHMEALDAVVLLLIQQGKLPVVLSPHKLAGEYDGLWECHVENDWLLIYDANATEVLLIRTGTHDDLF